MSIDYLEISNIVSDTIAKGSKPLTDSQRIVMAGAIAVVFEKELAATKQKLEAAKQRELELLAMIKKMKSAAQAVVDRWETPYWKEIDPTATFIYALRDALPSEPSQALREHEAKVLEDAADWFEQREYVVMSDDLSSIEDYAEAPLRRMAEERRKK